MRCAIWPSAAAAPRPRRYGPQPRRKHHPKCCLAAACQSRRRWVYGEVHHDQRRQGPKHIAREVPVHATIRRWRPRDRGASSTRKPLGRSRCSTLNRLRLFMHIQHSAQYSRDIDLVLPRKLATSFGQVSGSKSLPAAGSIGGSCVFFCAVTLPHFRHVSLSVYEFVPLRKNSSHTERSSVFEKFVTMTSSCVARPLNTADCLSPEAVTSESRSASLSSPKAYLYPTHWMLPWSYICLAPSALLPRK